MFHPLFVAPGEATAVPVTFVTFSTWEQGRVRLDAPQQAFATAVGFEPKSGRHALLPGPDGTLAEVLFALESATEPQKDLFRPVALAGLLPAGTYRFANQPHD